MSNKIKMFIPNFKFKYNLIKHSHDIHAYVSRKNFSQMHNFMNCYKISLKKLYNFSITYNQLQRKKKFSTYYLAILHNQMLIDRLNEYLDTNFPCKTRFNNEDFVFS